jgi:phage terminase large subunit-like protein
MAEMTREQAIAVLERYTAPARAALAAKERQKAPDIAVWAQNHYYIPENGWPIVLQPHQVVFNRLFADTSLNVSTYVYSTVKKSGKTANAGICARYTAENSGNSAEVYFIANDKEQAKDRAYESAKMSIEKTPGFNRGKRELPGAWRIVEKRATHLPTGSFMQALAGDYEGAAGGNPTGTFWTELWAFVSERFTRLWDELTPVPTRERSFRFVETYAGFIDESKLLYQLYTRAVRLGTRLDRSFLEKYADPGTDPWPFEDEPPFYINEAAGTLAYWDDGKLAQGRMPWQVTARGKAYYQEQAETERPESYQRLHLNYWVTRVQTFIQAAQWTACRDPLPATRELPPNWPIVVSVDGSVSSDCTAIVGVAREPILKSGKLIPSEDEIRVVFSRVWIPPKGGVIDLDDVENYLRAICGRISTIDNLEKRKAYEAFSKFPYKRNVVEITYDAFQLHQMMTNLNTSEVMWCRPFNQAGDREIADKALYDLIMRRMIHHNDEFDPEYMSNAAAYEIPETSKQQGRLRIVKKAPDMKVDPVVALSMACRECIRLLLS